MSSPFGGTLATLIRQRGVLGSLVVSEEDGIVVDSNLQVGINGAVVAALAASLYRKARLSSQTAGLGDVAFLTLEAELGRLCAVGRNGLVLVAIAEQRANLGLIRMEMLKAAESGGLG